MALSCDFCYSFFSTKQRLQYHIDNKVCKKDTYFCSICHKEYKTKQKLLNHFNLLHSNTKKIKKEHKSVEIIDIICNNVHKLKKIKDLSCNSFDKLHNVAREINNILIKNNYLVCSFCNKSFSRKDVLIRHQKKYCIKIFQKNVEKSGKKSGKKGKKTVKNPTQI